MPRADRLTISLEKYERKWTFETLSTYNVLNTKHFDNL